MEKKNDKVIIDQKEVENFNDSLSEFNVELKERLSELKDNSNEVFFMEDLHKGLKIELHSRRFSAEQLANLGIASFNFLESKRQLNKKPLGV